MPCWRKAREVFAVGRHGIGQQAHNPDVFIDCPNIRRLLSLKIASPQSRFSLTLLLEIVYCGLPSAAYTNSMLTSIELLLLLIATMRSVARKKALKPQEDSETNQQVNRKLKNRVGRHDAILPIAPYFEVFHMRRRKRTKKCKLNY